MSATAAAAGARMRPVLLRCVLLLSLVLPALAEAKKKSKFLAAYPMLFKFFLFWWCVFVFAVMGVYIMDHLLFKKYGPAKVLWSVEHTFKGSAGRAAYWAQVVDPREWKMTHPVLQSANVRMVKIGAKAIKSKAEGEAADATADGDKAAGKDAAAEEEEEPTEGQPSIDVTPIPHGLLAPGLGLMLRHKEEGVRLGSLFCTRECVALDTPEEGPWRLVMKTVDVGAGYPFLQDTEESTMEMWPPAKDGSIRCSINGSANVNSRVFRWWTGLQPASRDGAVAMLQAMAHEVEDAKKKD